MSSENGTKGKVYLCKRNKPEDFLVAKSVKIIDITETLELKSQCMSIQGLNAGKIKLDQWL